MTEKVWSSGRFVNIDSEINMGRKAAPWVDAPEAIALLGISRATLYAYVSRGSIRSQPMGDGTRRRKYSREDMERLLARARERRDPGKAAEQALHWGMPILESAITLIADGRIFYRGHDATALAVDSSVADVAALLWMKQTPAHGLVAPVAFAPKLARREPGMSFIGAAQASIAVEAGRDAMAFDLRARSVALAGWRILWLLAGVSAGPGRPADTIDATLAEGWAVARHADLIRAALILSADHELNVSAFTARCVASAGSSPYAAVIAGLAALEGTKHGGTTARIDATWTAMQGVKDLKAAIAERLRRGESLDGFGHPLYPRGDPRAKVLLDMLPAGKVARFAREFADSAKAVLGDGPTIDFALVAVARALQLPAGSPLVLFAIGRTMGWIGHAIEQYETQAIIRPRARYVGVQPLDAHS
jgi:citrate synthase